AAGTALVDANGNTLGEHDIVDGTAKFRQELIQRPHQLLRILLVAALLHMRHAHLTDVFGRQFAFACVVVGDGDRVGVVEVLDDYDRADRDLAGALGSGRPGGQPQTGNEK